MAWTRVIDVALFNHAGTYQTKFAVDLEIGKENIAGNYTPIKRRMVIYVTGGTVRDESVNGYIDGYHVYAGGGTYTTAGTTVWQDSINVYHDNDGTKRYSINGRVRFNNWRIEAGGTGSRQLANIPRAAKITACVDFTDEDNPTISISNPGGFNMEGWLEPNPNGEHLAVRTIPTNATSYTWELTDVERKQLRTKCTSNQCTIRVGLHSKNKEFVDYKDVKYNIINADPTFTTASFATQNNTTLADTLTIIKGYSTIKVTLGKATAKKEATIESYKVICGSVMKTGTELIYTLENVDDSIIRCYATDSRGNTTEKIINVTKYIDYTPITADLIEYERSEGGIGKGVTITFKGNLWVGNFGKLSNTITAQYFYKKRNASTWAQGTTSINPTVLANYSKTVSIRGDLGASGFDNAFDYDIKVIVSDRLSNDEKSTIISKGQPHLDFCEHGIALGGRYDESVLVNGEHDPLQVYSVEQDKMMPSAYIVMYNETTKEIKTLLGNLIEQIKLKSVYTDDWFKSAGKTGWRNETYGGGFYMEDSEQIKVYGNKDVKARKFVSEDRNARCCTGYHADHFRDATTYLEVTGSPSGAKGITWWASDKSLKEHIRSTRINEALNKISQLKHVEFDFKENNNHVDLGYIADDVEKVLPCLTFDVPQYDENGKMNGKYLKHINHTTMIPLITIGIQELIYENELLWTFNNQVVEEFEKRDQIIADLTARLEKLENGN